MQVPLKMTFRNVQKDAAIETLIRKQATKLERVCPYVVSCQVSIEKPQSHQKSGNPFRVRVDVTVPPEHKLVTIRNGRRRSPRTITYGRATSHRCYPAPAGEA